MRKKTKKIIYILGIVVLVVVISYFVYMNIPQKQPILKQSSDICEEVRHKVGGINFMEYPGEIKYSGCDQKYVNIVFIKTFDLTKLDLDEISNTQFDCFFNYYLNATSKYTGESFVHSIIPAFLTKTKDEKFIDDDGNILPC